MTEGWMITAASVTGPSHLRRGTPNQDAVSVVPDETPQPVAVVFGALSDGHGAQPHFRSDRGARLAVDIATEALEWANDGVEEFDPVDLARTVVEGWRKRVGDDIAQNPYNNIVAHPLHPYGATILGMMADMDQLCLLQLGDGDILLGFSDGRIERPIPPEPGLIGEQTYSLCLPDAKDRMRIWYAHRDWDPELPDFALLATDGVSKSIVSDTAFFELAAEYRTRCLRGPAGFADIAAGLPDWLKNLAEQGAGDDTTIILAIRLTEQEFGDD